MPALASFQRWLFRLAPDEQLPIVLSQRRIFIVPTRAGILYAVVLMVMLIGAINYNLSLGHALIFLLAGLGIVAMVHTFHNLFGLRLTPGRVPAVFAGDLAHFPLQLENTRRQTRRALEFSFAGQATSSVDLPAEGRASVAVPFATQRRGRLDPGRVTLATRYPLGLFRAWSYPTRAGRASFIRGPFGQRCPRRRRPCTPIICTATTARKILPACGRASSATRPGTSPGKRSPGGRTNNRTWSSSSPVAPPRNCG
jgi:hypothetical protein